MPDPAQVCQSPVKLQREGLDLSPLSRPGKGLVLDSATNADLAGKDRAKVLPHHRAAITVARPYQGRVWSYSYLPYSCLLKSLLSPSVCLLALLDLCMLL